MKTAIMQPYAFPYIGYFQLVNAVDTFVFYDDVNFIKRGWINRNQILVNNSAHLFTIPLKNASQNKLIQDVELKIDEKWLTNFYSTIEFNYKKAPFFKETFKIIQLIFNAEHNSIADLAIDSITTISNHLELSTVLRKSSTSFKSSTGIKKADRLIDITKKSNADTYINPSGGKELYDKNYFEQKGINLQFIENRITHYPQFKNDFVGGLSIIDVLMFNSVEDVRKNLNQYKII